MSVGDDSVTRLTISSCLLADATSAAVIPSYISIVYITLTLQLYSGVSVGRLSMYRDGAECTKMCKTSKLTEYEIIGSNCPGIPGTVSEFWTLSLVPEGLAIVLKCFWKSWNLCEILSL